MRLRNTRTAATVTAAMLAIAGSFAIAAPARAETSATCAGFIDALPATIDSPGTWCLRKDVATAIATGYAIEIKSNNVTLDCNGFRVGGLAAGDATGAMGIVAINRLNATVRDCNVRGFAYGVYLWGGGHAVLDSRFDQNTHKSIFAQGGGLSILRNRVLDTGGSTSEAVYGSATAIAIQAEGDGEVAHNSVLDTFATPGRGGSAYGILYYMVHGAVHDNTVGGLSPDGAGKAMGISGQTQPSRATLRDNHVSTGVWENVTGTGLNCVSDRAVAIGNVVNGFATGINICHDGGGNVFR